MNLETEIEIDVPAAVVWSVLMDFSAYSEWNPFIRRIEGRPDPGCRLTVRIEPPGASAMTFRPVVLAARPQVEFRWRGKLLVGGLFDGEHSFLLEELPRGRTRLVHREDFSGLLVPLFRRSLDGATRRGFVDMNQALKRRCESI